jgi:hypothetical protein
VKMKVYHCGNPEENPVPGWMWRAKPAEPQPEKTLLEQFKENPDSFFPEFVRGGNPAPMRRFSRQP